MVFPQGRRHFRRFPLDRKPIPRRSVSRAAAGAKEFNGRSGCIRPLCGGDWEWRRREEVAMIQFTDHTQGNAKVVAAKGRLDATTAHLLEVHCGDLLRSGCKCVVFDFRELAVLSSAGLRAILGLSKRIHAGGGKLVFTGVRGSIRDMFDVAGFLDAFPVVDQVEPDIA